VAEELAIEVVYALPERQLLVALRVPAGTTARGALELSGLAVDHPEVAGATLGVFGRTVDGSQPLRAGDRVEVYRPLRADPKEVRRQLAAQGRTMGKGRPPEV
jgi:hypothetical protein